MEKRPIETSETGYFFIILDLLVGVSVLTAIISIGVMLYAGLQAIK